MNNSVELKPCPFCGCKHLEIIYDGTEYTTFCYDCVTHGPLGINEADAFDRWNQRYEQQ